MSAHTYMESRVRELEARRPGGTGYLDMIELMRAMTRIVGDDTTAKSSDGASITIAVYQVDISAGKAMLAGEHAVIAALGDKDLLNPAHIKAFTLVGAAPAAHAAGLSVAIAIVLVYISNVATPVAIFGAQAASGSEAPPTLVECRAALRAAVAAGNLTGWVDAPIGLHYATVTPKRVQVDTHTFSNAPEVGDNLNLTVGAISTDHVADSTVLNDEVGDLRTLLIAALAAEPVTVGGATNAITITWDDDSSGDSSSLITLTGGGSLAVIETSTDTMSLTHADPAADSDLLQRRQACALAA